MVGSNVASMATQGTLAALLLTGRAELWMLIAIAALNGVVSAFFFPASQGIVPQTVPVSLIQQANALLRLAINSMNVFGAAIGGIIVAATSPGLGDRGRCRHVRARRGVHGVDAPSAGRPRAVGELPPRAPRGLAGVPLAHLAVVDRPPVLDRQHRVPGALLVLGPVQSELHFGGAGAWGAVLASESAGLICGGLLMLRFRPDRLLLVATFAVLPLALPLVAARQAGAAAAVVAARRVRRRLRARGVRGLLGHDDAAADPRRDALPRLRLRHARLDRARSRSGSR